MRHRAEASSPSDRLRPLNFPERLSPGARTRPHGVTEVTEAHTSVHVSCGHSAGGKGVRVLTEVVVVLFLSFFCQSSSVSFWPKGR